MCAHVEYINFSLDHKSITGYMIPSSSSSSSSSSSFFYFLFFFIFFEQRMYDSLNITATYYWSNFGYTQFKSQNHNGHICKEMVLCDDFFGINFIILKFSLYILESRKLYRCYKLPQNSKSNWFFPFFFFVGGNDFSWCGRKIYIF